MLTQKKLNRSLVERTRGMQMHPRRKFSFVSFLTASSETEIRVGAFTNFSIYSMLLEVHRYHEVAIMSPRSRK